MGKRNKYRNYALEDIKNAVQMVESKAMSIRSASRQYNVPKTTIIDKLNGISSLQARSGPSPVLFDICFHWVIDMAKIGYGQTRQQLLYTVKTILDHDGRKTPFKDNLPGKDWLYAFMKRHPEISTRTPQKLGKERAVISWQKIKWWFEDFAKYLTENYEEGIHILKDASRIYNADESGFPQDPKSGKILAAKGSKNVYSTCSADKSQITVLACMSATAHYLPPMLVFPGERFRFNPLEGFTEAVLGRTKTGWMDSELFYTWVRDHFITAIKDRKVKLPVILLVDGHTSHISLETAQLCKSENVILYCLLEHASHILQPCDVTLFGPLKKHWRDSVRDYQFKNPGEFVTKGTFASVFKSAWAKGTTVDVAIKGFRHTGLYPFSVESVDKSKVEPSEVFARAKPDQDLGNDDDMNCKDAQVDSRPVTNSSGTYNLDQEPVQIADEADTEIALMPSEIFDSVSCETSHTIVEELHDQPPCLYPEIIIQVNPCNVNVTPHKDENKQSCEKAPSSSFELLLVTPSEQKTLKKKKTRTVLPKAVSGSEMIKIVENRKQQKEDEQEMKEKRKIDRELKRKLKEEANAKKEEKKMRKRKEWKKIRNVNYPKNKRNRRNRLLPGFVPSVYLKQTIFIYVARFAPPFIMQNALVLTFLVCILTTSLAFHMSVMIASKTVRYIM
ncbi:uncharacterized protein LOC143061944 [Mytilus galloprovincialis]|uniref:uncharacterized protein LOC143061944 n=1 Tax=Mytilus galloprovincialis TaxID=29158 RepID=UPI003F7C4B40